MNNSMHSKLTNILSVIILFLCLTSTNTFATTADEYYREGCDYYEQEKFEKAAKSFEKAIELNPDNADCHYNLGIAYLNLERYKEALEHLEKAKELAPNSQAGKLAKEQIAEIERLPEEIKKGKIERGEQAKRVSSTKLWNQILPFLELFEQYCGKEQSRIESVLVKMLSSEKTRDIRKSVGAEHVIYVFKCSSKADKNEIKASFFKKNFIMLGFTFEFVNTRPEQSSFPQPVFSYKEIKENLIERYGKSNTYNEFFVTEHPDMEIIGLKTGQGASSWKNDKISVNLMLNEKNSIVSVILGLDYLPLIDEYMGAIKMGEQEGIAIIDKLTQNIKELEVKREAMESSRKIDNNISIGSDSDGFRNIKWGTDISALPEMKYWRSDPSFGGTKFYLREGDELRMGAAILEKIEYAFWRGKFLGVQIFTTGFENWSNLKSATFEKFGKGYQKDKYLYTWQGPRTWVALEYDPISKETRLIISSAEIYRQQLEYQKEKAKEGARKGF